MSEQVRRVWISTRAHDRATGEWLTVKGEVVPTDDYAALRAEAEALRAQRDKMAQILRDLVPGCKWRFMRPRIDQALQEVDGGN